MGSSTGEVKHGGWTQRQINGALHHVLGGPTPQVNGQDQIVQLENYCYSS